METKTTTYWGVRARRSPDGMSLWIGGSGRVWIAGADADLTAELAVRGYTAAETIRWAEGDDGTRFAEFMVYKKRQVRPAPPARKW